MPRHSVKVIKRGYGQFSVLRHISAAGFPDHYTVHSPCESLMRHHGDVIAVTATQEQAIEAWSAAKLQAKADRRQNQIERMARARVR